ncbi:DUF6020 family protein [Bifidobacterium parmae]|uniref:Glycosyltransferase RgtA/B/C/D-like domain-containing protein n=1 Tax=Bifidobacterium parmae TaxID=361854 RepID=A0A2N5J3J8_9BIFI|nr:DUF6020 family protein [Bifidobacterium parmae]PLS28810.1 hypothetical protein Uis4E_1174 [Bifidobacterium parmae]
MLQHLRQGRIAVPIVLGIVFGLCDAIVNTDGRLYLNHVSVWLRMAMFVLLFVVAFIGVDLFRERVRAGTLVAGRPESAADPAICKLLDYSWTPRALLKLWGVILVCWLPYMVMLFPGVYWADDSGQLLEHYGANVFTDHHPFLVTMLYGGMADIGQSLFGNPIMGLYILVLLQQLFMPLMLALTVMYCARLGANKVICTLELMLYALFPAFPILFSSLVKDTLSALFFTPFCLLFVEVIRRRKSVVPPMLYVGLFATGLLSCLTKKPCVYIIVPSLIFLCALGLAKRTKIVVAALGVLIAAIMLVFIPKVALPAVHAQPGGKQEAIPYAIQMVAHDVKYGGGDMSATDRQLVSDFLSVDYDKIPEVYTFYSADPVKLRSLKNPDLMGDFLKLWVRKSAEHPVGNLEAYLGLVQGWFDFRSYDGTPAYMVVLTDSEWFNKQILDFVPQWPVKSKAGSTVRDVYDAAQSVPVLNLLFTKALWASIIPFFLLYEVLRPGKGKFQRLVAMMPLNMSFACLLMVPISAMGGEPTRYILQLMCVIPLFLVSVLREAGFRQEGNEDDEQRRSA